jgi:signal peptidase I
MAAHLTAKKLASGAAAVVVVASAWFFLAPAWLGGSTHYVVTDGVSMQPRFHTGDLALVRAAADYRVGEIVAYRSRELRTIVLHRIIGLDGNRYVFKGDNNDFVDPEHPARSQLVGRLWLHVPGVGARLQSLRSPRLFGALVGLAAFLLLGGGAAETRRRRRRRSGDARPLPRPQAGHVDPAVATVLAGAGLALGLFVLIGALAVSTPTTRRAADAVSYSQHGTFSYSARTPSSDVYPDGTVVTGDPLFLKLVDRVHVRFDYRLDSPAAAQLDGRASLAAKITSSNGWRQWIPLESTRSFSGSHVVLTGSLDLRSIPGLLDRIESVTQVVGTAYTLTLVPRIAVHGSLGSAPLRTSFFPHLDFRLDSLQLQPNLAATGAAPDPLHASSSGSVQQSTQESRLLVPKLHLSVSAARAIAGVGSLVALLVLLGCGHLLLTAPTTDEAGRIQSRYRDLLVSVRRSRENRVEVESMESLARIAERYERLILHEENELGHSYRVEDDGVVYEYRVPAAATPTVLPSGAQAAPRADLAA